MKTLLIILLFAVNVCAAQDSTTRAAGVELIKFNRSHSTGTILGIGGAGVAVIGFANNKPALGYIGGLISLIGLFVDLNSYQHIYIAGVLLKNNGIAIPIKGKRNHVGK